MPPCAGEVRDIAGSDNALQLSSIKKAIPEEAFKKSMASAFWYMFFDYALWGGSTWAMYTLCNSSVWTTLSTPVQLLATLVFWNVAGFFMWGIFVIGHDCGHGTFSDSEMLNDIVGHITHGSILVPYYSWQISHRRHHMYHNHIDKDYSHPWYSPDRLAEPQEDWARFMDKNAWMRALFPVIGWHVYLMGKPDGSHYIPFAGDRLWRDSPVSERLKGVFSTIVVVANLVGIYFFYGQNLNAMGFYYFVPYCIYAWWLVTVTYLQHHAPDTLVYDDADWTFTVAAFQTIDRTFGFGIDKLHHHITDGHVVHHLFFTKIPHYNLPMATKALTTYMKDKGLSAMYQHEETHDFPYRVFKYFVEIGFRTHRAADAQKESQQFDKKNRKSNKKVTSKKEN